MYQNILIPVDMSHPERAPLMIEAAKKLASKDTKYILANIVYEMPLYAEAQLPKDLLSHATNAAKQKLADIAKDQKIDAELVVKSGHPASDILNLQEEKGIDLIIVGSHKPGFEDYLLGSTAARVVRHAPCPVLVIR